MLQLTNGATINYRWINPELRGPVIVFLHEGLGSIAQWKSYPELLCKRLRLPGFIYDRQGHGLSSELTSKRDETYLENYATFELPQIVEAQLKDRELILYGHSDGGSIALIYASCNPGKVHALVTEAAHIYVEQITWDGIQPVIDAFKQQTQLFFSLIKYHGEKTTETFYAWANTWAKKKESNWNISHYLERISAPLLAFQGKDDQYATEKHLFDICNGVAGSNQSVLINNCKHSPFLEQQEIVLTKTTDFLSSLLVEH